jgi:predicted  nucleic acid-binding Zn-ribbon protein
VAKIDELKVEIIKCEEQLQKLYIKERAANEENRNELNVMMPQITALSSEENQWSQNISVATDRLENLLNAANNPQNQLKVAEEHANGLKASFDREQRYVYDSWFFNTW